jgi:hypothetical protein
MNVSELSVVILKDEKENAEKTYHLPFAYQQRYSSFQKEETSLTR